MEEQHEAQKVQKKNQRPLVGLFVILFVGISIVGLRGITHTIQDPFAREGDILASAPVAPLSADAQQAQTDEALKKLDTDKDGLNDYDEISIYGTSAFLDDSDGDGYSDKTELLTGHDPRCNETTEICGPNQDQLSRASVSTSTENIPKLHTGLLGVDGKPSGALPLQISQNVDLSSGSLQAVTIPGFEKPMTVEELRNLSPQEIRDFLIRQGAMEKDLKNMDDATLKKIYSKGFESAFQQVAKEQEQEAMKNSGTPVLPQISQIVPKIAGQQEPIHPETMSVAQLRDLLRKSGKISEQDLQKIDDETLKTLVKQVMVEVKK